jgi:hypothetical protein
MKQKNDPNFEDGVGETDGDGMAIGKVSIKPVSSYSITKTVCFEGSGKRWTKYFECGDALAQETNISPASCAGKREYFCRCCCTESKLNW